MQSFSAQIFLPFKIKCQGEGPMSTTTIATQGQILPPYLLAKATHVQPPPPPTHPPTLPTGAAGERQNKNCIFSSSCQCRKWGLVIISIMPLKEASGFLYTNSVITQLHPHIWFSTHSLMWVLSCIGKQLKWCADQRLGIKCLSQHSKWISLSGRNAYQKKLQVPHTEFSKVDHCTP